jgi:hypothetical protein
MPFGYIYKIVFPNGKHYIGLTATSLEQRTKEHKCCAKSGNTKILYKALRKYDMIDTLELIEIDTADTEEELYEKEIGYILIYNSYYMNENGYGYNMTFGGEGTFGYVHTEEDKQRMRKRRKQYFENNPEVRKEHGEKMKKYHQEHPEARKEHGEKMKKHYENPEAIQKNREAQQKYHQEHPEAREQMSEIKKQYYENNPDARKQMSEIKKQYYENNPDARKQNGEKMQKYHQEHPEAREQMSEIKKQYYENNPDARQKLSDGKGKNKTFDAFKTDGTFIKTFTYQFEAKEYLQKEYNITSTFKISEVLAGNRKSSAGFVFKYK